MGGSTKSSSTGTESGALIDRGAVTLLSRRNLDWTAQFPEVAAAAKRLKVKTAMLDGELAAVLPDGRTSFHAMQSRSGGGVTMAYFVFDLWYVDGDDLTGKVVGERKTRLRTALGTPPAPLRYVDHVVGGGAAVFAQAAKLHLEGIVSKSRTEPYRAGARHRSWQKSKCQLRQEFVVGGWQPSVTGGLGAMLLGYYDEQGRLVYAGKVGTGHQRQEQDLLARFVRLKREAAAFEVGLPRGAALRNAKWLEPVLVVEVAFIEWTSDGLRHPSFQGLRQDKAPRDVRAERPV